MLRFGFLFRWSHVCLRRLGVCLVLRSKHIRLGGHGSGILIRSIPIGLNWTRFSFAFGRNLAGLGSSSSCMILRWNRLCGFSFTSVLGGTYILPLALKRRCYRSSELRLRLPVLRVVLLLRGLSVVLPSRFRGLLCISRCLGGYVLGGVGAILTQNAPGLLLTATRLHRQDDISQAVLVRKVSGFFIGETHAHEIMGKPASVRARSGE